MAHLLLENREWCEEAIAFLANRSANLPSRSGEKSEIRPPKHLGDKDRHELERVVRSVASLQERANSKLTPSESPPRMWWVTDRSLQQATPWQVAKLKSTWFERDPIYDLCCGIGGDAIALAARGDLTAVDLDPTIAAMAEMNLANAGRGSTKARARCADVAELPLPTNAAIHIDPDRRPDDKRRSDPSACQPAWPDVRRIVNGSSSAVIKLAPAASISEADFDLAQCHRVWISLQGSVREQSMLCGAAVDAANARRGGCSAAMIRADQTTHWFLPDADSSRSRPLDQSAPQSLLIDPNAAIRAAGLTEAFAKQHDLNLMSGPAGFLTGKEDVAAMEALDGLAVIGGVEWWGSCDDRKLRKELRSRGVYPAVVKVRGTDHDPSQLVKRYRKCGDRPVKLWIGRAAKRVFAAITQ